MQMPLLVPCPVTRRSSPAEDYMATLSGVSSLIDQQQQLLRMFQSSSTTTNTTNNNNSSSSKSNNKTVSDEKVAETAGEDLAASSSSMQTLRRIMEIEELRKFSDILESKLEGKHTK